MRRRHLAVPHQLLPRLVLVAALGACAPPAAGHEFWIAPSSFTPGVGGELHVRLLVGESFRGRPVPRQEDRFSRFALVDGEGEREILGRPGDEPAGSIQVRRAGWAVVLYHSNPAFVELDASRFEAYLRTHGLEEVVQDRAQNGESTAPVREAFSRCAKSILGSGDGADGLVRSRFGLELELVPDEMIMRPGPMLLTLYLRDEPVAGALLLAWSHDAPARPIEIRTDAHGQAQIPIDRPGNWLVSAVRIRRPVAPMNADWESLWASLTFSIPGHPAATGRPHR